MERLYMDMRKNNINMPSAMAYVGVIIAFLITLMCLCGCGDDEEMISLDINSSGEQTNPGISDGDAPKGGSSADSGYMYVYVCGAVLEPGVYELKEGSRIVDAVLLAGGMTDEAAPYYLNQAAVLSDGDKLYIPTAEELSSKEAGSASEGDDDYLTKDSSGLININTAGLTELMTIPGIGQQRAQSIIDYRNQNGNFASIEDVMKVPGIKSGMFSKIEPYIRV